MLLRYMSLILLFIPRDESQYTCAPPYICKTLKDCIREQNEPNMKNKVVFPCGRDRFCCLTQVKIKPTIQNIDSTSTSTTTTRTTKTTTEKAANEEQFFSTSPKPPSYSSHPNFKLFPKDCGRGVLFDKIVDGNDTLLTEFPWMVLLGYRGSNGKITYACGGSLISDRYILTAAHCLKVAGVTVSTIRLGEWDIETNPDCVGTTCNKPPVNIKVGKIIQHEDYDKLSHRNDIALLRLSSNAPIKDSSRISPICMPFDIAHLSIGDNYHYEATGWGITGNGENTLHNILQKVGLDGVNLKDCNERACTSSIPSCPIEGTQVCVQGKVRKDVCKGDSGGPLMTTTDQKTYQIGITSIKTTEECGAADIPSIFTRVESYLSWILDKIEP